MRRVWKITLSILGCLILTGLFLINIWWTLKNQTEAVPVSNKTIPTIEITLNDITLKNINEGSKDTKYDGNELVLKTSDGDAQFFSVEIKGRGNSTWGQSKKPYQIKFDQKVDLFNLGKAKKWVLLANYFDTSHLRNDLALFIERMLEMDFALNGEFINLVVDGENLGLYYLTPKVEVDKNRIDLREPDGILVELDNLWAKEEELYKCKYGHSLTVVDVVNEDILETAMNDFVDSFNKLESAAKKGNFKEVERLADVKSLAKYYILSEFTANPDAYASSLFLYKDGALDKIHIGLGWDFDYALGNKQWVWASSGDFYSPSETKLQEKYISKKSFKLFYYLMQIPEFKKEVNKIYQDKMMGRSVRLLEYFDEQVDYIEEAAVYNNEKWELGDFMEEVDYLREWLISRYDYFDRTYGGLSEK